MLIYKELPLSNFHPSTRLCFFSVCECHLYIPFPRNCISTVENTSYQKTFLCPWSSSYLCLWGKLVLVAFLSFLQHSLQYFPIMTFIALTNELFLSYCSTQQGTNDTRAILSRPVRLVLLILYTFLILTSLCVQYDIYFICKEILPAKSIYCLDLSSEKKKAARCF